MHGRGAYVVGGMHGGCAWQGCVGVCMAGCMCGRGHEWQGVYGGMHPTGMHSCLMFNFVS